METVLPEAVLRGVVDAAQFEQRARKRDALLFLRAMVIAATSPSGGRQVLTDTRKRGKTVTSAGWLPGTLSAVKGRLAALVACGPP